MIRLNSVGLAGAVIGPIDSRRGCRMAPCPGQRTAPGRTGDAVEAEHHRSHGLPPSLAAGSGGADAQPDAPSGKSTTILPAGRDLGRRSSCRTMAIGDGRPRVFAATGRRPSGVLVTFLRGEGRATVQPLGRRRYRLRRGSAGRRRRSRRWSAAGSVDGGALRRRPPVSNSEWAKPIGCGPGPGPSLAGKAAARSAEARGAGQRRLERMASADHHTSEERLLPASPEAASTRLREQERLGHRHATFGRKPLLAGLGPEGGEVGRDDHAGHDLDAIGGAEGR